MNIKELKPIMIENSKVPVILSKFAPITIGAIALFPFVFSVGKMSEDTKRHETIHFQQQLETGVLGFYLIYLWDYAKSILQGVSGAQSYRAIRAEKEAHGNEHDKDYLSKRVRYAWLRR